MKKILIVTNHSFMLYKFRKELIQELLKENEVILSMPKGDYTQEFIQMGCKFVDTYVDRRGINPITDSKLVKRYYKLLKSIQPDMVITYSIKPNIYSGFVCRALGIEYCANITGLGTAFQKKILANLVTVLYRQAFKKVKVVFFENSSNREEFLKRNIIKKEHTCLLNGAGVNLEEFAYKDYPEDKELHFIFVGRIMKEKGVDELFQAARTIKKQYSNVVFDIVGPFEDDYKETVEKLQEEQIIRYHGFQKDVRPYLEQAHCLILPSYHEGMANTILEAAAVGRPVIVSDIPGCREGVVDGETGYLVKVKEVDDLTEKIKVLYEQSQEQRLQLSYNARKLMSRVFNKQEIIRKTTEAIKSRG